MVLLNYCLLYVAFWSLFLLGFHQRGENPDYDDDRTDHDDFRPVRYDPTKEGKKEEQRQDLVPQQCDTCYH